MLSHFRSYKVADRMRLDPVLVTLALLCVNVSDWSWTGGSDDFVFYDFATGAVHGFTAESIVPVKRYNVDKGSMVPVMVHRIDTNRLLCVTRKEIFETERSYRRYRSLLDDVAGQPAGVPANVVDDLYYVFVHEVLCDSDGGSCLTADALSVFAISLARLSKIVPTSESACVIPGKEFFDDVETSHTAIRMAKKADQEKRLPPVAEISKKSTSNDGVSLIGRITNASTRVA